MHFVLSYSIDAERTRRKEIEERVDSVLEPYQRVKRLESFYVIKISEQSEWESIRKSLDELVSQIEEDVYFIMVPPVKNPEKYNGILLRGGWDEINEITQEGRVKK